MEFIPNVACIQILQPMEVNTELVKFNTSLLFRSSDLVTRVLVTFGASQNDPLRPYTLGFHNLASGDRGGDKPVELKHGGSGWIWIDGGSSQTHTTDAGHRFTIFDTQKAIVFSVTLLPHNDEL